MNTHPPRLDRLKTLDEDFKSRKDYEKRLADRQQHLLQIQQALYRANERAIIVFEGPDASGKGGVIRRATQWLDPRGFRVHAVGAPNPEEQGRHYLWRFFQHLPPPGRIAIFDRSWYGRVLVERVEELVPADAWRRAFREINEFERWLLDDGVRLCKVYLSIDRQEQDRRFEERLSNPRKYWKLTDEDIRNRLRWDDYRTATDEMFLHTHTERAPWHLVDGRHKWRTRVHVLNLLCEVIGHQLKIEPPGIDPELLRAARIELGLDVDDSLPPTRDPSAT